MPDFPYTKGLGQTPNGQSSRALSIWGDLSLQGCVVGVPAGQDTARLEGEVP